MAAFAARSPERALRVFAVGDATAAAARAQRFKSVLSAQGDVAALASALTSRRRELSGVILYPAAAEPSQDLAAALAAVGLQVRQAAVYETVAALPSAALAERLPQIDGVLLHSAKAAQGLARFLKDHPAPALVAYCLSRADRPRPRPRRPRPAAQRRAAERDRAHGPGRRGLNEASAPPMLRRCDCAAGRHGALLMGP